MTVPSLSNLSMTQNARRGLKRSAQATNRELWAAGYVLSVSLSSARRVIPALLGEVAWFQVATVDTNVHIILRELDDLLAAGIVARRIGVRYSVIKSTMEVSV